MAVQTSLKKNVIVLVTGGREFTDKQAVYDALDAVHSSRKIAKLVHGHCPRGADALADEWATERKVPMQRYPANWDKHKKAADFIRNQEMLDKEPIIDGVIAFPGGSGTADMIKRSHLAGKPIWQPYTPRIDITALFAPKE